MPRHARLDAPGFLHHVIVRGIERTSVFSDESDKRDFIERCGKILPETHTACYAWSLLSNHVHLLLRTGGTPLSTVMARLLTGYANSYNLRHRRSGHLFQNRYKSIICQEDTYCKELVRYIHLNPVRAGLADIKDLQSFPWSGHGAIMGTYEHLWQDIRFVRALFGSKRAYSEFVRAGIDQGHRDDLSGGGLIRSNGGWTEVKKTRGVLKGDDRILGDTAFVMTVLANERLDLRYAMKASGITLETVEKRVAELFAMAPRELYEPGRQKRLSDARSVFCFFAVRELGISMASLAERFAITGPAISYSVKKGGKIVRKEGWTLGGEG